MGRGGLERFARLAHRWLGMGALGFLLLSVVTGLLWADAKFLYWDEPYKEKVRPVAGPPVDSVKLPLDQALLLPIRDYVNLVVAHTRVQGLRFSAEGWFPILVDLRLAP